MVGDQDVASRRSDAQPPGKLVKVLDLRAVDPAVRGGDDDQAFYDAMQLDRRQLRPPLVLGGHKTLQALVGIEAGARDQLLHVDARRGHRLQPGDLGILEHTVGKGDVQAAPEEEATQERVHESLRGAARRIHQRQEAGHFPIGRREVFTSLPENQHRLHPQGRKRMAELPLIAFTLGDHLIREALPFGGEVLRVDAVARQAETGEGFEKRIGRHVERPAADQPRAIGRDLGGPLPGPQVHADTRRELAVGEQVINGHVEMVVDRVPELVADDELELLRREQVHRPAAQHDQGAPGPLGDEGVYRASLWT